MGDKVATAALRSAHSLSMMVAMNRFFGFAGALILAAQATVGAADIQEKAVEYKAGEVLCEGWHGAST